MMSVQLLFIGTTELLLIGGMALLLFGGKKLPEMMRGLGQGVREFKKRVTEVKDEINDSHEETPETEPAHEEEPQPTETAQKKTDDPK